MEVRLAYEKVALAAVAPTQLKNDNDTSSFAVILLHCTYELNVHLTFTQQFQAKVSLPGVAVILLSGQSLV